MSVSIPHIEPLSHILPDDPLLMMGAGPVPLPPQVSFANSLIINHLGDTMARVLNQVKEMGRYVFQTQSRYVLGVAGPGSAAMEMAICNLIEPKMPVLSICNGYFSKRMAEMARRAGGEVRELNCDNSSAASVEEVEAALKAAPYKVITLVQGETSNTVWNKDLQALAKLAKKYACLVIVDAVCTLSTMPLEMDEWGIDAVITGGQKGLSSIPGVSLMAFSETAWECIKQRQSPIPQWCFDARLATKFWHENDYHYTAPVSGILALHEALRLVCEETLVKRFQRHLLCSTALQAALEGLGLKLFVDQSCRLNSVIGICLPEGIDSRELRKDMSDRHGVEISGSFGHPILRIGQMGEQCRSHHLFRTLHALGRSLTKLKFTVDLPTGMATLERHLSQNA